MEGRIRCERTPLPGDFVGPTTGILSYAAATAAGTSDDKFSVQLDADAAAPRNESFSIELFNPPLATLSVPSARSPRTSPIWGRLSVFVSGTLIATARGYICVEDLAIGDIACNGVKRASSYQMDWPSHN